MDTIFKPQTLKVSVPDDCATCRYCPTRYIEESFNYSSSPLALLIDLISTMVILSRQVDYMRVFLNKAFGNVGARYLGCQ